MDVHELRVYRETVQNLNSKERLGNVCVLLHAIHYHQSCFGLAATVIFAVLSCKRHDFRMEGCI
jgi:hypothetical protein